MRRARGSRTGGTLGGTTFLKPRRLARALFHPAWTPDSLDPSIERIKRVRIIAGPAATLGVHTFLAGGFDVTEPLTNTLTAAPVLRLTPLTVGVMLLVRRRTGTVRQPRVPSADALGREDPGLFLALCRVMLLLFVFVFAAALRVSGNFFGTGAVHRSLPALFAVVTCRLMSLPDLITGDPKGLGPAPGVVFVLAAPVTVTGIALLELRRLKRRYGIRLTDHPATRGPFPGLVPQTPAPAPETASHPVSVSPHAPASGQPHTPVRGNNPHASPQSPYAPGTPGLPSAPSAPQNPYVR
ncbi:hypothetical protein [Streptomyces sp. NBRC 110035]|uniref:hypothetical protein n=1 Tax=Streptomyces sp. NBRC 110035 TaxID=1547867 RepID=UPI0005A81BB9|nr:hypothetical protein [Streptomyces sp. NBRC 110035]